MDKFGCGKRILIGMPDWFLYKEIKSNLENFGFEVVGVPFKDGFKYKTVWDRIYNTYRKVIKKDYTYKSYLKFRDTAAGIVDKVEHLEYVDYALFIRADYYTHEFLSNVKQKTGKLIGYQWDGLDRFPSINPLISLFDRFFVFDPEDLSLKETKFSTNFYFPGRIFFNERKDINVYYLGSYMKSRMKKISDLSDYLKENGIANSISVFSTEKKILDQYANSSFDMLDRSIPYSENLDNVDSARALVDFVFNVHNGLSFRIFEAIGNDKKLITDNEEIKKYDFYDPSNIYVIKGDNYEGLKEFLEKPYKAIDASIKYKYSFENWIRYVLDIHPYIPIESPSN